MSNHKTDTPVSSTKGRFALGICFFGLSLLVPLLIPLVVASSLPSGWKVTLSGALALGIPEVLVLLATIVLGKSGFNYLKKQAFRLFKRYALPKSVSRTRYHIGLVLFIATILIGWVVPYLSLSLLVLETNHLLLVYVLADFIFLISIFVLGGDFWDKLKSLFIYETKAHLPENREKLPLK